MKKSATNRKSENNSKSNANNVGSEKSNSKITIQPKLTIGEPNDQYEQEADNVAAKVMSMSEPQAVGQEEEEEKLQAMIMRKEKEEANDSDNSWLEEQINNTKGSGNILDDGTRSFMENRIGADFGNVKVHTDSNAVQMNKEIGAHAFTHGNDIYFNSGQYNPESSTGKHLIAHELTHTIQQGGTSTVINAEFAVAPTTPDRTVTALTATQIQDAIAYNQARHTDVTEISLMRDILGLDPTPAVIDESFVNAVVEYQTIYSLSLDGRIEGDTASMLAREIIAEANYLGPGNEGDLAPEFILQTSLQTLVSANNTTYADYKTAIQGTTMLQQRVVLNNQQLLNDIKGKLSWNDWAKCIELLGRRAPTGDEMLDNFTVRIALNTAWEASNVAITIWASHSDDPADAGNACNPAIGAVTATTAHEEGGFVYMNLLTGNLSTIAVSGGAQAGLTLNNPATVADSVVVGGYHTHPNVGVCWGTPFFSPEDEAWSAANGVPILMKGAFPSLTDISNHSFGNARLHLAGNRGLPGASGGIAPQATICGSFDEI
ncbi:MAG: DUF4157 domain-containing protein [Bacteroidales bacterium]